MTATLAVFYFEAPVWLLLLPALFMAAAQWRQLGILAPLPLAVLTMLIVALANPMIDRTKTGLHLYVLSDQSPSAADTLQPHLLEWEALLERGRGSKDAIHYIDYADDVILRTESDREMFSGKIQGTRTALAIEYAMAQIPPRQNARLLLLTDGYSTEPIGHLAQPLIEANIALDYRLAPTAGGIDFRIHSFTPGSLRVTPNEPFLIEFQLRGNLDSAVNWELQRNGQHAAEGTTTLHNGRAVVRLTDRRNTVGAHHYELRIDHPDDSVAGNNTATFWLEVTGTPRILLATAYVNDPVATVLRNAGFTVEATTRPGELQLGSLSGAAAVIINDVPANAFDPRFLSALPFYVRQQAGGLIMTGGRHSFGSGGYFESPLDPLLPVSMELRQDERRVRTAVAIVMDRSGSMSAAVPGQPGMTKMDLANIGAASAVELLAPEDLITVYAVDTRAHEIVPIVQIGSNPSRLINAIRSIRSTGGGIFVYTGLKVAWEQLEAAPASQKHIILFADAADAEEPGNYRQLLEQIVAADATVSVISLGFPTDRDAEFLMDIAERGNGRLFFNSDPNELPALFAQDIVAVDRATFISTETPTAATIGWLQIAATQPEWPPAVDGYNLSYLRPNATASLFSDDEYSAPLVAFWDQGAGRVGAVTFPLAGEFAGLTRSWPGYADFIQTLTRWVGGDDQPPGLYTSATLDGTRLSLRLDYDETQQSTVAANLPHAIIQTNPGGDARSLDWQQVKPGSFITTTELMPDQPARGAIRIGNNTLPFGPMMVGRNPEWDVNPQRIQELRDLARASGGGERLDLPSIWQAAGSSRRHSLTPLLLVAALCIFLIEALLRRINRLPSFQNPATSPLWQPRRRVVVTQPQPAETPEPKPPPEPDPIPTPSPRRAAFQRAKRKTGNRSD